MSRVYINEKVVNGQRVAMSSPTAVTVRREGTVVTVDKNFITICFDDAPAMQSRIKKAFVNWITPEGKKKTNA